MASDRIHWKESVPEGIKHIEHGTVQRNLNAGLSIRVNPRPDGCRKLAGTQ